MLLTRSVSCKTLSKTLGLEKTKIKKKRTLNELFVKKMNGYDFFALRASIA